MKLQDTVRTSRIWFQNDVGGTQDLVGSFRVRIVRKLSKGRYVGELLEEEDVQRMREAGVTGYTPEHYTQYLATNPSIVESTRKAAAEHAVSRTVYIGTWEVIEVE